MYVEGGKKKVAKMVFVGRNTLSEGTGSTLAFPPLGTAQ